MSTKKNKPPLTLDMEFGEALRRFVQTDPSDLPDKIRLKGAGRKPAPKVKALDE